LRSISRFALKIVKLYRLLSDEKREYVLSKQLLRSGTSIGANIKEGLVAQSRKDFIAKLFIALKEASETEYWIGLLIEAEYLEMDIGKLILEDLYEIIKLLNAIIKTTKKNSSL
jgi:four helix bundle protein